ncbi:MAG: (5-formylfuran-3-yl)methyl phosphate synthase, partial [Planctomycetota bacterium]
DPLLRSPGAPPLLLASVRSIQEAILALSGGADVLDVKEPREGSLGAAPPAARGGQSGGGRVGESGEARPDRR